VSDHALLILALVLGLANSLACWLNARDGRRQLGLMRRHFKLSTMDWLSRMTPEQRKETQEQIEQLLRQLP
jgi:hypothetical protein